MTSAYNYIPGPHIVNEFRVGWTGSHAASVPGIAASTIAGEVGILPPIPQDLTGVNTNPNFKIAGFQSTFGSDSSINNTETTQILDNFTLTPDATQ